MMRNNCKVYFWFFLAMGLLVPNVASAGPSCGGAQMAEIDYQILINLRMILLLLLPWVWPWPGWGFQRAWIYLLVTFIPYAFAIDVEKVLSNNWEGCAINEVYVRTVLAQEVLVVVLVVYALQFTLRNLIAHLRNRSESKSSA